MEHSSSSDAGRLSGGPEFALILWGPKVRSLVYKNPLLFPILSQINRLQRHTSSLSKTRVGYKVVFCKCSVE